MKKTLLVLIWCCPLLISCAKAPKPKAVTIHQEQRNKIVVKKHNYPKLNIKNLKFGVKVIHEASDASKKSNNVYFINFKYPVMDSLTNRNIQDHINGNIKTKVEAWIKNYKKDNQVVTDEFATTVINMPKGYNFLSIKFTICIDKSTWPPLNKPIYKIMTLNYDLDDGKEMHLENLFKPSSNYLPIIAAAALADLKEQSKNSSDLINISEADIKAMTAPKPENYRNFLFNDKGIIFILENDKILHYQANYPKVLILYGKIEKLL
jgi:hypothetical protein